MKVDVIKDKQYNGEIPSIIAFSFFSGAMGLDIGMKNMGIEPILACEKNKYCRETITRNNKKIGLLSDINKYNKKDIMEMANLPYNKNVDIMFGGPPCQAFSTAGKQKGLKDERGNVFLKFIDLIGEIQPKYIVIENVRGLLSAKHIYKNIKEPLKGGVLCYIIDKLKEYGYSISFNLYNVANFGVAQTRERIVIIGKLGDKKLPYLTPTHSENGEYNLPKWNTLKDCFSLLPKEIEHHYIQFPEKRLKFYKLLKEGQCWKSLPIDLQKEAMGKKLELGGGKTGFYRRLSYEKPSPTLVTNPTMPATDLCHPTLNRPLSVEEYKCIQGFPNDWEIYGPILEQYRQIGNAVPIKFGEAIERTILNDINKEKNNKIKNFKYSKYKNTNEITFFENIEKIIKNNHT